MLTSFAESLAAMTQKLKEKKRIAKGKVSGLISFSEGKVRIFASEGEPDPNTVHAIIDRGDGTVVGLFFSSTQYTKILPIRENTLYRLQPFV